MHTTFEQFLADAMAEWRSRGLERRSRVLTGAAGPRINIGGREYLNFSSNDYLGLANDALLKQEARKALENFGVGAGASRLICGNLAPYSVLEAKLARFKRKEAALVFGSGYAANVGVLTALMKEGDIIIMDKLCHASMIDGARLSKAHVRVYPHRDMKKLEGLLAWASEERSRTKDDDAPKNSRHPNILVVTESVFSMDGDHAPLEDMVELKEKHGAWLMVDEAHATGVFGKNGRGLAEEVGIEEQVEITMGTLSKAFGCQGGYIVGSLALRDFLWNRARSLVYSTAMPPSIVAAACAAVNCVSGAEGRRRRERLWKNVDDILDGLASLGRGEPHRSPIIPMIIGEEEAAVRLSRNLFECGVFIPAIRYPTVPSGQARLRVTVTAVHTADDIGRLMDILRDCAGTKPNCIQHQPVGAIFNRDSFPSADRHSMIDREAPAPKERRLKLPHQSSLRKNRFSLPGRCYFVTTCIERRRRILSDPVAAIMVMDALRWLRDEGRIRLLGFVVMPDHVHFAFVLQGRWSLEKVMQSFKRHTSRQIRAGVGATCSRDQNNSASVERIATNCRSYRGMWQTGYYEHLLRDDEDFRQKLDYMHANPVRKGLAEYADAYPYSTAHRDHQNEIDWDWVLGIKRNQDER